MTTSAVSINTWHHIAFVVTPTTLAYYLNGTLIQSTSAVIYNTNRLLEKDPSRWVSTINYPIY